MIKQSGVSFGRRCNRGRAVGIILSGIFLGLFITVVAHCALYVAHPNAWSKPGAADLMLTLLGSAYSIAAREVGMGRAAMDRIRFQLNSPYWRWLLSGCVACIILAIAFRAGAMFLLCGVACWCLLSLSPLFISGINWHRLAGSSRIRILGNSLFAVALALLSAEIAARAYEWASGVQRGVMNIARQQSLIPHSDFRGRTVNRLGYWGDEFQSEAAPGIFRIAALGDQMMLSGTAESNFLSQLKRRMPHTEIYNFGLPSAGPREYAAQLSCDVATYRPDLVLAFVSVGDDVTQELPAPDYFDWRSLGLYQLGAGLIAGRIPPQVCSVGGNVPPDADRYLSNLAASLAICRTPLDDAMHDRWQFVTAHLTELISQCEARSIPVVLVVVPAEFQVNRTVREIALRRAGLKECQLDLDLPQRRLAAFAEEQEIPVIDLLPLLARAEEYPYSRNEQAWNDLGNTITADALSGWLDDQYGVQIATIAQAGDR